MKKIFFSFVLLFVFMVAWVNVSAQVVQGKRIPVLNSTQRNSISNINATTARGQLIYNSEINCLEYWDGSKWVNLCEETDDWTLTGNAGTSPSTNFVGTTDNQPLMFKVNNKQAGYISNSIMGNNAIGLGALPYEDNYTEANNAFGYNALAANMEGFNNVAVGNNAMAANIKGHYNVAVGNDAMLENKTGSNNTAIGNMALYLNNDGKWNTAVGDNAMVNIVGGSNNAAFGNKALGGAGSNNVASNNVAFGYVALSDNEGNENAAVGAGALTRNSTGSFNTAVGTRSLNDYTTGQYNIALGWQDAGNTPIYYTGSNNILLGANVGTSISSASNELNIGNVIYGKNMYNSANDIAAGINTPGRIGIGTTVPQNTLEINGGTRTDSMFIDLMESAGTDVLNVVWNRNTKRLEVSPGEVAIMTFLQTEASQTDKYSLGGNIPEGATGGNRLVVLPWNVNDDDPRDDNDEGDVIINNGLTTINDNVFTLTKDANVELSGYCGYSANVTDGTVGNIDMSIIVNASIQIKRQGTSDWVSYSSVRGAWFGSQKYYRHTLAIPPAMFPGQAGDQIRMVMILKPENVNSARQPDPALVAPYGTLFSKSIKIVQM